MPKKQFITILHAPVEGEVKALNIKNPILIINEEGRLHDLPINPHFPPFLGNVFLVDDKDMR